jgi:hypothetical protein
LGCSIRRKKENKNSIFCVEDGKAPAQVPNKKFCDEQWYVWLEEG